MSDADIRQLLSEIRDDQRLVLAQQRERLELARAHLELARTQIDQSIGLQREALARARTALRIVVPRDWRMHRRDRVPGHAPVVALACPAVRCAR